MGKSPFLSRGWLSLWGAEIPEAARVNCQLKFRKQGLLMGGKEEAHAAVGHCHVRGALSRAHMGMRKRRRSSRV